MISIIALLIALLLPAIKKARRTAFLVTCQSNLRQIGVGIASYAGDAEDYFPVPAVADYYAGSVPTGQGWPMWLSWGDESEPPNAWAPADIHPADDRPLASLVPPDSEVFHCPEDVSTWENELPWFEPVTTSYPANNYFHTGEYPSLWGARIMAIHDPSLTVMAGDFALESNRAAIAPEFPATTQFWWHMGGPETQSINVAFADGHAGYVAFVPGEQETEDYSISPCEPYPACLP